MAKILVIDDDPSVRETITRILRRTGHQVFEAADGVEGVSLFRLHKPAIVVTDIFMPEQEGIETIKQIRAEDGNVRVLTVSGGGAGTGKFYLRASGNLGADATLAKPFRADELIRHVDALLAARTKAVS